VLQYFVILLLQFSAKNRSGALAERRQRPKTAPARLPNLGKGQKPLRRTCRTSAKAKNRSGALAEPRQRPKTAPARSPNLGKGVNDRKLFILLTKIL